MSDLKPVRIAPNNPVFDLPVIVGIEAGLFAQAGLDVSFAATYDDREKDNAETPYLARLKESLFEQGKADSYNVCEWAILPPFGPRWRRRRSSLSMRNCRCRATWPTLRSMCRK